MAASSRTLFLSLSTRPGVQNAETARCRKEKFFARRCRVAVFSRAKTKSAGLAYIWPLLIITDNICNRRGWREIIIFLRL